MIEVAVDDLSDGAIERLLEAHLQDMHHYSPPESIHALDPTSLRSPKITFWGARVGGVLAGCGALKEISSLAGEVKSMKTDAAFLRQGIAARILETILQEAERRGYAHLSLETGSNKAFFPAIELYRKYGFAACGPFGDYVLDPYSLFMTKRLAVGG
ncbi:MAG: GNAT family N-acetyltransferase [Pseudomonadota bacterium]